MSLDPPPYLGSLQNNIRQRPIPWDGAVRANTLNEGQLAKIRAVDKVRKDQRKQVVESDLDGYRALFVGGEDSPSVLESASKRTDVVQYILVLLNDLLESMPYNPRPCSFSFNAVGQPKLAMPDIGNCVPNAASSTWHAC